MTDRYPGCDVKAKQDTPSWDQVTREVVARRLAVPRQPRFFNEAEWQTLDALCDRIVPQPGRGEKVPLPAYVDAKITENHQDGDRYATLPRQGDAWRRGLAALDAEAQDLHGTRFRLLEPTSRTP